MGRGYCWIWNYSETLFVELCGGVVCRSGGGGGGGGGGGAGGGGGGGVGFRVHGGGGGGNDRIKTVRAGRTTFENTFIDLWTLCGVHSTTGS